MTFEEFRAIVMPLSVALGAAYDLPTWKLYHRALESVPAALLAAAVQKAAETRTKMPTAAQLRELAEAERQALIAAHPWTPCCECEASPRFRPALRDGIARLERCPCVGRHREMLAGLGVGTQALALPAASHDDAA